MVTPVAGAARGSAVGDDGADSDPPAVPLHPAVRSSTAPIEDRDRAAAVRLLRTAQRVLILAHRNPDADALGSALALARGLQMGGCTCWVSFDQPREVPRTLAGLPGAAGVVPADDWFADGSHQPDLVVTVDCGAAERVGRFEALLATAVPVLVIDHHASNPGFGDVNLIDPGADSTTVLIDALLADLGIPLDAEFATLLYAGLATDTGSFRRAGAESLRSAARYVDAGVDGDALLRRLSDSHPFGYLRALARALARVELLPAAAGGLGLVHTHITVEDLRDARAEDAESVIDVIRTAEEAAVAAVFKEQPDGSWLVSLRSRQPVMVTGIAQGFGGGGHAFAAGYSWVGDHDTCLQALLVALG